MSSNLLFSVGIRSWLQGGHACDWYGEFSTTFGRVEFCDDCNYVIIYDSFHIYVYSLPRPKSWGFPSVIARIRYKNNASIIGISAMGNELHTGGVNGEVEESVYTSLELVYTSTIYCLQTEAYQYLTAYSTMKATKWRHAMTVAEKQLICRKRKDIVWYTVYPCYNVRLKGGTYFLSTVPYMILQRTTS